LFVVLARDLEFVRQRHEAATVLLRQSQRAEAFPLAIAAFERARAATAEHPVNERLQRRLEDAARELDGVAVPEVERAFEPSHAHVLEQLLAVTRRVERDLRDATLDPSTARRRRIARALTALLVLALVGAAIVDLVRGRRLRSGASAASEPGLSADNVVDDDLTTEWSLPAKIGGHVDVGWRSPRTLHRVRILNSKNLPSGEHGAREFRVEVFVDDKPVTAVEDRFESFSRDPEWKTIEFGEIPRAQGVRIIIKSWFGDGGGLTEVVVE